MYAIGLQSPLEEVAIDPRRDLDPTVVVDLGIGPNIDERCALLDRDQGFSRREPVENRPRLLQKLADADAFPAASRFGTIFDGRAHRIEIAPGVPSTRRPITTPGISVSRLGSTATSSPPDVIASPQRIRRPSGTDSAKKVKRPA